MNSIEDDIDLILGIIIVFFVIGVVCGLIVGHKIGRDSTDDKWQTEIIKRGYAEFNPTNAVWQWKEGNFD